MKLTFCGAARIVTGSCYLLEVGKYKILVDCGMFQGSKNIVRLNYEPFLFDPKSIDYVFLTHAHLDHSGLLPKLRKGGFKGKIFSTSATIDLVKVLLEDSAHIHQSDTRQENKRRRQHGLPPRLPLYNVADAKTVNKLFKEVLYGRMYNINNTIKVRFMDAGHIIGSAIIEMYVTEGNKEKKIVFSGDLGQWNVPIVNDPSLIDFADYVFIESTYGDRLHEDIQMRDNLLLDYVKKEFDKGGKLLIPSFAIERTQEILYSFNKLIKQRKMPKEKIFLDSPLAIKATNIFKKHNELFDEEAMHKYPNPFDFSNLVYCTTRNDSIKLNTYRKPCVIIAGSGMCTGGRIRHHIRHAIDDKRSAILFVGYQAEGTLGRVILEGNKHIRMMGREYTVKFDVNKINSFSAHADYKELLKWSKAFKKKPKKMFVVHGEEKSSVSLKKKLERNGFTCHIPEIGESVEL